MSDLAQHTTGYEIGQVYAPAVNWTLAVATLAAVIGFGSSDALAGAYGIAVSLLMAITTLMAGPLLRYAVRRDGEERARVSRPRQIAISR